VRCSDRRNDEAARETRPEIVPPPENEKSVATIATDGPRPPVSLSPQARVAIERSGSVFSGSAIRNLGTVAFFLIIVINFRRLHSLLASAFWLGTDTHAHRSDYAWPLFTCPVDSASIISVFVSPSNSLMFLFFSLPARPQLDHAIPHACTKIACLAFTWWFGPQHSAIGVREALYQFFITQSFDDDRRFSEFCLIVAANPVLAKISISTHREGLDRYQTGPVVTAFSKNDLCVQSVTKVAYPNLKGPSRDTIRLYYIWSGASFSFLSAKRSLIFICFMFFFVLIFNFVIGV